MTDNIETNLLDLFEGLLVLETHSKTAAGLILSVANFFFFFLFSVTNFIPRWCAVCRYLREEFNNTYIISYKGYITRALRYREMANARLLNILKTLPEFQRCYFPFLNINIDKIYSKMRPPLEIR